MPYSWILFLLVPIGIVALRSTMPSRQLRGSDYLAKAALLAWLTIPLGMALGWWATITDLYHLGLYDSRLGWFESPSFTFEGSAPIYLPWPAMIALGGCAPGALVGLGCALLLPGIRTTNPRVD